MQGVPKTLCRGNSYASGQLSGFQRAALVAVGLALISLSDTTLAQVVSTASSNSCATPIPADPAAFSFPATLASACSPAGGPPHPLPDPIGDLLAKRQRYRLVIGVSEYKADSTLNRPSAETTAQLIDARLARIGFCPIPSRIKKKAYLSGTDATKANIKDALKDLALHTTGQDIGVVYYIGHGSVTPNHSDVSLSVYDRPVSEDEGIRLSDILGFLTVGTHHKTVPEIPRVVIMLDSCYAGNAAIKDGVKIESNGGLDVLTKTIRSIPIPDQIAVLSASGTGDTAQAFDLTGSQASAFGAFVARALGEEWECVDDNHDGVITVNELHDYIKNRLNDPKTLKLMTGQMTPLPLNADPHSFVAYSGEHWFRDSQARPQIRELLITSDTKVAKVTFPSGTTYECPPDCEIPYSASIAGDLKVSFPSTSTSLGVTVDPTTKVTVKNGIATLAIPFKGLTKARAHKVEDVTIQVK